MGLLRMLFSSHKETAQELFDKFNKEVDGVMQLSKQYNKDFFSAGYTELIKYQKRNLKMFYTEIQLIKEPVRFYAHGRYFTPIEAVNFMENFIVELEKHNIDINR